MPYYFPRVGQHIQQGNAYDYTAELQNIESVDRVRIVIADTDEPQITVILDMDPSPFDVPNSFIVGRKITDVLRRFIPYWDRAVVPNGDPVPVVSFA